MPRIRTLKPEIHQHRKVGPLSDRQFRTWIGCLTQADDEGRFCADPDALRATVFAYHPKVHARDVQAALDHLAAVGLIHLYAAGGVPYGCFPSWTDHQRIHKSHFSPSRLPPPDRSGTSPVPVPDRYGTGPVPVRDQYGSGTAGSGSGSDQDQDQDRRGRESEGRGDASPLTPPLVTVVPDSNQHQPSTSSDHPPLRRPAPGEFADILARLRDAHPDLPEPDIQSRAVREFNASLR
jgi:hypothetical protein